jgi:hypothetical protein
LAKYRTSLSKPSTWLKVAVAVLVILALGAWIGGAAMFLAPGIAGAAVFLIVVSAIDQE